MRVILFVLILAVIAIIAAIATGFLNISQTRSAQVPNLSTTGNGVAASGGQVPAFEVETGSVRVGTSNTSVQLPKVEVEPAGDAAQPGAQAGNAAVP